MATPDRLEVSYTSDQERRLLELVARAADVFSLVSLAQSERLSATLPGGLLLTQRNAICRSLISIGTDPRSALLGGSPEHQAQVLSSLYLRITRMLVSAISSPKQRSIAKQGLCHVSCPRCVHRWE